MYKDNDGRNKVDRSEVYGRCYQGFFIFDFWFSSKKSEKAALDIGADMIGVVKINTKVFCKNTIEKLTKDWPGGSYLVLKSKPMVPGGGPLISIGYKYNAWKVIPFIVTADAGRTKSVITYLSKYPDPFSNVPILPFARPLVMYKFFGSINEVDSHKKPRQYGLALEKF